MAEKNDVTKVELTSGGKPPKVVEMPDGSTVEYPADMSNEEIGRNIVKSFKMPAPGPAGSAGTPNSAGGGLNVPKTSAPAGGKPDPLSDILSKGLKPNDLGPQVSTDQVLNFLRPMIAPAVGTAVGTATSPFITPAGGLAAGAAAYTGVDALMQHLTKEPEQGLVSRKLGLEPGGVASTLTNTGEMAAGGKLFDWLSPKIMRGIVNAAKEMHDPGAVVGDIYKLNPTYSQYFQNTFGKRSVSKWIEDILGGATKTARQEESAQLGKQLLTGGRKPLPNTDYDKFRANLLEANARMKEESIREGNFAVARAELNPGVAMVPMENPALQNYVPTFNPQTGTAHPPPPKTILVPQPIAGPIKPTRILAEAEQYLKDQKENILQGVALTDEESRLGKIAREIIGKGTYVDPATGKTMVNDISFRDMWDFKQAADEIGHKTPFHPADPTLPSSTRKYFRTFSDSANEDISSSVGRWANDPGGKALQAWENSKAIAGQRQILLNDKGTDIKTIIDKTTTELPALNALIADPHQLENVMTAGEFQFPGGGKVYTTTRNDLKGYQMDKMFNRAWKPDPINPNGGRFDSEAWDREWNDAVFNNGPKQKLFNAGEQNTINETVRNLARTQVPQTLTGSNTPLWIARGAIMIAPQIALGHLSGAALLERGAVAAVGLSGLAFVKAMNNPSFARAMAAASSGQPLNASYDFLARTLAKAATGTTLNLVNSDGKETKVKVGAGGKLTPVDDQ